MGSNPATSQETKVDGQNDARVSLPTSGFCSSKLPLMPRKLEQKLANIVDALGTITCDQ